MNISNAFSQIAKGISGAVTRTVDAIQHKLQGIKTEDKTPIGSQGNRVSTSLTITQGPSEEKLPRAAGFIPGPGAGPVDFAAKSERSGTVVFTPERLSSSPASPATSTVHAESSLRKGTLLSSSPDGSFLQRASTKTNRIFNSFLTTLSSVKKQFITSSSSNSHIGNSKKSPFAEFQNQLKILRDQFSDVKMFSGHQPQLTTQFAEGAKQVLEELQANLGNLPNTTQENRDAIHNLKTEINELLVNYSILKGINSIDPPFKHTPFVSPVSSNSNRAKDSEPEETESLTEEPLDLENINNQVSTEEKDDLLADMMDGLSEEDGGFDKIMNLGEEILADLEKQEHNSANTDT